VPSPKLIVPVHGASFAPASEKVPDAVNGTAYSGFEKILKSTFRSGAWLFTVTTAVLFVVVDPPSLSVTTTVTVNTPLST
jgi:hypothetical protein